MAHLLTFRFHTETEWLDDLLLSGLKQDILDSFKIHQAARIIQKHIRGFITRRCIMKWHRSATIIQKTWKGYMARVFVTRYAKKRFYECRQAYYDNNATIIQSAWRAYKERSQIGISNPIKFFKETKLANKRILAEMSKFHEQQVQLRNEELINEKKELMNYVLPKLHHLIRTKAVPGIYSLKDGSTKYSSIEKLLKCYEFGKFMKELYEERKKKAEYYHSLTPDYTYQGICNRFEKIWKRKNILEISKL